MKNKTLCESCLVAGIETEATGHSKNPDWSGYVLCDECRAEYDARAPINEHEPPDPCGQAE